MLILSKWHTSEHQSPRFAVGVEFNSFSEMKHFYTRSALLDLYEFVSNHKKPVAITLSILHSILALASFGNHLVLHVVTLSPLSYIEKRIHRHMSSHSSSLRRTRRVTNTQFSLSSLPILMEMRFTHHLRLIQMTRFRNLMTTPFYLPLLVVLLEDQRNKESVVQMKRKSEYLSVRDAMNVNTLVEHVMHRLMLKSTLDLIIFNYLLYSLCHRRRFNCVWSSFS